MTPHESIRTYGKQSCGVFNWSEKAAKIMHDRALEGRTVYRYCSRCDKYETCDLRGVEVGLRQKVIVGA